MNSWTWYAIVGCVAYLLGFASSEVSHRNVKAQVVLYDRCDLSVGCR